MGVRFQRNTQSSIGIIEIDPTHIKNNDWIRIQGGTTKSINEIYSAKAKFIAPPICKHIAKATRAKAQPKALSKSLQSRPN